MPAIQKEDYAYVRLPSKTGGVRRVHAVDHPNFPDAALAGETLCALDLEEGWEEQEEVSSPDLCQTCARIQRARLRELREADVLARIREGACSEGAKAMATLERDLLRALGAVDALAQVGRVAAEKIEEALRCLEALGKGPSR